MTQNPEVNLILAASQQHPTPKPAPGISPALVLTMATACGMAVANLYYAQPLLHHIAQVFQTSEAATGWVITASQLGFALGLLFLLPAGDMLDRRKLVLSVLAMSPFALLAVSLSPTFPALIASCLAVGLTSVVVQVMVPFAASLATDEQRGRVVGTVISGLLIGILGARTLSGAVSQVLGWQAVYYLAAVLMAILFLLLWRSLPEDLPKPPMNYGAAIRSVGRLLLDEPVVRLRSAFGALAFAAFSVFWTTVAFVLSGPPYHYNAAVIGLFGLVGAMGALSASYAGRLADRGGTGWGTGLFTGMLGLSFAVLWLGGSQLWAMIAGIFFLDIAAQGMHVLNQSEIYRVAPNARSRVNSAYMTSYFLGGAAGSAAGTAVYGAGGWTAVSLFGGVLGLAAFCLWVVDRLRGKR
ncbi:MAG: putative permease of the major facilitator superfamily [Firmicutes bacterium]|nr:putative permease of the major facilitator superfamily [Bacillota bacterium]